METPDLKDRDLRRLIESLEEFRKFQPDIQAQTILTFLYAALWENRRGGVSVKDLGDQLGVSSAASSRNVSNLTEEGIQQKGGFGLLKTVEDPMYRVRKVITLTGKGQRVMRSLLAIMER